MSRPSLCIFGEVLFDHFPDGQRVLGGAPFNVAWHLAAFGATPRLLSAVGLDAEGQAVRAAMTHWGMDVSGLAVDRERPTGAVRVRLEDGEPRYDILLDCAYDATVIPDPAPCTDLLYHGTLALRRPLSAATLGELKEPRPHLVFFDANLRDPWWTRASALALAADADWVKLNHHELAELSRPADAPEPWAADPPARPEETGDPEQLAALAERFVKTHALRGLVVTRGAAGAMALAPGAAPLWVAPAPALEVVDTVGAGDAFTAVLILGIVSGWPLATTLERAQSFATRIVGQRGATSADRDLYAPFVADWKR